MVSKSGNADTVDDQLLVIGVTQNRMVFNVELYEKCAMAYTLARLSGEKMLGQVRVAPGAAKPEPANARP
ncbi:MAG: hypothetical protein P8X89_01300 [Reinekea sp.]